MVTLASALVCFAIVICFWEELLCFALFLLGLAVCGGVLIGFLAMLMRAH